jgi:hypothetical protein
LVGHEYFSGHIPQDLDPLTFQTLGWYAIDKHNVYYYRPISGGMFLFTMEEADAKTFKILDGHYCYAQDKHHFYEHSRIIENYNPQTTTYQRDRKGKIMSLSNKMGKYDLQGTYNLK